jgi:hypothetical protein
MSDIGLNNIKNKALNYLKNLENSLNNVEIINEIEITFEFKEIKTKENADKILEKIKDFQKSMDSKNNIYVFQLENSSLDKLKILKSYLEKAKIKDKGKVCYSRILKTKNPKSIYVGSSSTDIKSRLNNHFGHGYKGTYSLHLSKWLPHEDEKIKLKILKLSKEINLDLLQLIEDFYWEENLPILGKKGGK